MDKSIRILKIYRGESDFDIKIYNGEGDIEVEGEAVNRYIYTDDTIFNLQARFIGLDIYPPHAYIWFDIVDVSKERVALDLTQLYYSTVKYEEKEWLSRIQ